jgi:hypothetical protein
MMLEERRSSEQAALHSGNKVKSGKSRKVSHENLIANKNFNIYRSYNSLLLFTEV